MRLKLLGLLVALLVLLPVSARAQSVKPTDIVGIWVGGEVDGTGSDTLVFWPDSTFRREGDLGARHWSFLRGDTLSLFGGGGPRIEIKKGKQLTLASGEEDEINPWGVRKRFFSYVGAPPPKPIPTR